MWKKLPLTFSHLPIHIVTFFMSTFHTDCLMNIERDFRVHSIVQVFSGYFGHSYLKLWYCSILKTYCWCPMWFLIAFWKVLKALSLAPTHTFFTFILLLCLFISFTLTLLQRKKYIHLYWNKWLINI